MDGGLAGPPNKLWEAGQAAGGEAAGRGDATGALTPRLPLLRPGPGRSAPGSRPWAPWRVRSPTQAGRRPVTQHPAGLLAAAPMLVSLRRLCGVSGSPIPAKTPFFLLAAGPAGAAFLGQQGGEGDPQGMPERGHHTLTTPRIKRKIVATAGKLGLAVRADGGGGGGGGAGRLQKPCTRLVILAHLQVTRLRILLFRVAASRERPARQTQGAGVGTADCCPGRSKRAGGSPVPLPEAGTSLEARDSNAGWHVARY